MTILLQIDIFPSILKKLSFNDLIIFRRVCFEWKEWIDDYLKRQKVLLLVKRTSSSSHGKLIFSCSDRSYECLTAITQTLNINYSRALINKLELTDENLANKRIRIMKSLIQTFPYLEELYITVNNLEKHHDKNYECLLGCWKSTLRKLIIPRLDIFHRPREIANCLNECDKLETFGLYKFESLGDPFSNQAYQSFIENASFLTTLRSLWTPSTDWILHRNCLPNLTGIVSTDDFYLLGSDRLPNIQRLYFKCSFYNEKQNICRKLQFVHEDKHENLSCFEFLIQGAGKYNARQNAETVNESRDVSFYAELNRFRNIKTLKFELPEPVILEYVLRNCVNLKHVETVIINYKDKDIRFYNTVIQLPSNFIELLPKTANRIRNMEFHLEKQSGEGFRKTDFSKFPYKVKIFHDL